jgi:uncharacterized membrane protein
MKKLIIPTLATVVFIASIVISTAFISIHQNQPQDEVKSAMIIPEDVNAVLQNKCFDCHNVEARSDKAKEKLLLDELASLKKSKQISKLDAIAEVCEAKDMPPEKFLAKYPEQALTDDEAKLITEWANKTADELLQ